MAAGSHLLRLGARRVRHALLLRPGNVQPEPRRRGPAHHRGGDDQCLRSPACGHDRPGLLEHLRGILQHRGDQQRRDALSKRFCPSRRQRLERFQRHVEHQQRDVSANRPHHGLLLHLYQQQQHELGELHDHPSGAQDRRRGGFSHFVQCARRLRLDVVEHRRLERHAGCHRTDGGRQQDHLCTGAADHCRQHVVLHSHRGDGVARAMLPWHHRGPGGHEPGAGRHPAESFDHKRIAGFLDLFQSVGPGHRQSGQSLQRRRCPRPST